MAVVSHRHPYRQRSTTAALLLSLATFLAARGVGFCGLPAQQLTRKSLGRHASSPGADQVKPLSEYVLVEAIDEASETESGLLIADSKNKRVRVSKGRVVAKGPGEVGNLGDLQLLGDIKEGDLVMWDDYAKEPVDESEENRLFVVPIRAIKAKVSES
mmetsp:Transcript_20101/g.46851  ORF Transcript_20101/g.46851 Transcript_20101/m.46851 type:complete len:158 (+) Transcript_20101:106-579(+)